IDLQGADHSAAFFIHGEDYPYEDYQPTLDGLTIAHCSSGWTAIDCYSSNPTIRNCVIRDGYGYDGRRHSSSAIICARSSAVISNCVISNMGGGYQEEGGAIVLGNWDQEIPADITINNCVITNNQSFWGAAIDCWGVNATINNCTIAYNRSIDYGYQGDYWSGFGAGIIIDGSDVTINNCIFWGNVARAGPQITILDWEGDGLPPMSRSRATVSYSDIQGGLEDVLIIPDPWLYFETGYIDPNAIDPNSLSWGAGNLDIDPCFVEPGLIGPGAGLNSYWMFDEGTGNRTYTWGGGNNGTVYGAQWTTGKVEGALEFDGVDDYVTVGKNDYVFPNNVLTWSVWINPSSYAYNRVILWDDDPQSGGDRGIELRNDGTIGAGEWFVDTVSSSAISLGEWHHIAFTSGDGEMKLYIDGELSATSSGLLPDHAGRSFVSIGSGHDGYRGYFHGLIDEVAIYNRAISSQEVQDIYQNGLNGHGLLVNLPGDYHLTGDSPCIDSGDPNYVAGPGEVDIDGNRRVVDGDGDRIALLDMGSDEYKPKYCWGAGTAEDPYQICEPSHLDEMGAYPDDWDKHFVLMADIDMSGYTYGRALIAPDTDDSALGFQGTEFTGVFDGNGYTIANLACESANTNYIGLFGCVDGPDAEIKDVTLAEPGIDAPTGYCVGPLVGYLRDGTITGCNSAGGSITGYERVGGVVGLTGAGTIVNCSGAVNVTGLYSVGGLVGQNSYDGTITNSCATGSATGYVGVGGLAGYNSSGTIIQCYATGDVTGDVHVGGLVGYNYGDSGPVHGNIANCYATGDVLGGGNAGGLVGSNSAGVITNCYGAGAVWVPLSGQGPIGGLVGLNLNGFYTKCFWDETVNFGLGGIGNGTDPDVIGESTANMQTESTICKLKAPSLMPGGILWVRLQTARRISGIVMSRAIRN
ncbi:MAG: LamG-like jellyroll fold domain-containing protein, partial [Planctomycetota bacterium]